MPYRYVTEKLDYTDYANGRVFYGTPGHSAFPVRLASEIFLACMKHWSQNVLSSTPCVLYDPVCGGAYHLSVLAYLHWSLIGSIIGSDIDCDILVTADKNLGLLSPEGMEKRINEIHKLNEAYGKKSHETALESAYRLRNQLLSNIEDHSINTSLFHADALGPHALINNIGKRTIDIVIADIPYGILSTWQLQDPSISNPVSHMLTNLLPIVSNRAVIAIASDKRTKISHPFYQRIERFQIGKRRIVILSPIPIK